MADFVQTAATEALAGLVERVTFHNPENGFCVLRVKARGQRDLITVVGHAAMISAGEFVQMSGAWVNDRTHGQQFRASFLKASPPTTLEGIERYLASGMIRGIGPVYAKRLVRGFGEAVFDLIEQQPERLREVSGIGADCPLEQGAGDHRRSRRGQDHPGQLNPEDPDRQAGSRGALRAHGKGGQAVVGEVPGWRRRPSTVCWRRTHGPVNSAGPRSIPSTAISWSWTRRAWSMFC